MMSNASDNIDKVTYECSLCGIRVYRTIFHDHYLTHIENAFNEAGFVTIREGKIPIETWNAPDLFVLTPGLTVVKILEVIVQESYERIREKAGKIQQYYNPSEIIIFEPVHFLNKNNLPQKKDQYTKKLGFEPRNYVEIEQFYARQWSLEGLNVTFWNEKHLHLIRPNNTSSE